MANVRFWRVAVTTTTRLAGTIAARHLPAEPLDVPHDRTQGARVDEGFNADAQHEGDTHQSLYVAWERRSLLEPSNAPDGDACEFRKMCLRQRLATMPEASATHVQREHIFLVTR
jgi:hypothetical protein